ncbi:MAG: ATP-dependent RecD-like DNA helicase [Mailhella sp.]|nr:ATP-dependent RecD-like DNA helicase [Mailhella sp.]
MKAQLKMIQLRFSMYDFKDKRAPRSPFVFEGNYLRSSHADALQAALNPDGIEALHGGKRFRIGDKVIQRRNNYMKNVFNGAAGTVTAIRRESSSVHVSIDGREVIYDYSELDELSPAYAISIHKSQGAEYPAVIIPLLPEHKSMLQRNLLYTAITRGKKLVVLVGSLQAVAQSVNNGKSVHRHGRLKERIRQYAE